MKSDFKTEPKDKILRLIKGVGKGNEITEARTASITKAVEKSTIEEVVLLDINTKKYETRGIDKAHAKMLKENLDDGVVLEPLLINKIPILSKKGTVAGSNFFLLGGAHRLDALLKAGFQTAPALVVENLTEEESRLLSALDNSRNAKALTRKERRAAASEFIEIFCIESIEVHGTYKMLQETGYTQSSIGRIFGMGSSSVGNIITELLKTRKEEREANNPNKSEEGGSNEEPADPREESDNKRRAAFLKSEIELLTSQILNSDIEEGELASLLRHLKKVRSKVTVVQSNPRQTNVQGGPSESSGTSDKEAAISSSLDLLDLV